jgi:hypothetical protein
MGWEEWPAPAFTTVNTGLLFENPALYLGSWTMDQRSARDYHVLRMTSRFLDVRNCESGLISDHCFRAKESSLVSCSRHTSCVLSNVTTNHKTWETNTRYEPVAQNTVKGINENMQYCFLCSAISLLQDR